VVVAAHAAFDDVLLPLVIFTSDERVGLENRCSGKRTVPCRTD